MSNSIEIVRLSKRYAVGGAGGPRLLSDVVASRLRREHEPKAREFWALRDVSFDVTEGQLVGMWDPLESTCRHASLSIL